MANTTEIIATINRNLEHNGLEITFSGVPSAKVRTGLKSNGFHWHNGRQIWYAKYNDKHVEFCKKMKWEIPEIEEEVSEVEEAPEANEVDEVTALQQRISELEAELASYKQTFAKVPKSEKTDTAILNRILKSKCHNNNNLRMAHKYDKGYGFTNGHYLLTDTENHGIQETPVPLNVKSLLDPIKDASWKLEIDLADLKKFAKEHGSKKTFAPYILEQKSVKVAFNPQYMIDCLTWCGTTDIWVNPQALKAPIYIVGEKRTALCLPINVK